ncbi:MAG: hypothetical protein PVF58_22755 [Candidatus Methanofastidiosia archaeon]
MELQYEQGKIIIENKVITTLDEFVSDFTRVLETYTDYTLVSGYVVILFGRARGTEDIDTIIPYITMSQFHSFYKDMKRKGYYFLNPEDADGLYEMLEEGLGIRIAKEDMIIPNIELKFAQDEFDTYSIENRVKVIIDKNHLFISPMELQIPYKIYLGSERDIEDAVYLWDIFKEKIDLHLLKKFMKALDVTGESYGIEI